MKLPDWTKPALSGAAVGAIALAVIGFSWGGWVTGGSAKEMARQEAGAAVAAVLTPYCVENARGGVNSAVLLAELTASPSHSRRAFVEKAGWATPLGMEAPNRALAQACVTALTATP